MSIRLRRANIIELLKQLILDNDNYTVAQLLSTIMRNKNYPDINPYDASDIELSSVLEDTIYELKKETDGE